MHRVLKFSLEYAITTKKPNCFYGGYFFCIWYKTIKKLISYHKVLKQH